MPGVRHELSGRHAAGVHRLTKSSRLPTANQSADRATVGQSPRNQPSQTRTRNDRTTRGPQSGRPRGAPSSRPCEARTGPSRRHKRPSACRDPRGSFRRSAAPRSLRSDLCPGSSSLLLPRRVGQPPPLPAEGDLPLTADARLRSSRSRPETVLRCPRRYAPAQGRWYPGHYPRGFAFSTSSAARPARFSTT